MKITTVGLDIAKRVFQLHGVDAAGKAVLRRKLQRGLTLAAIESKRRQLRLHETVLSIERSAGT